jgi:hypothetical protein
MKMDMSSVSSLINSGVSGTGTASRASAGRVDRDGDKEGGSQASGARRGGELFKAMLQTLGQLGFNVPKGKGEPPATESQANDAANAAAASQQNVGQAVNAFMHSLFQTLGAAGAGNAQPRPEAGAQSGGGNDGNAAVSSRAGKAYGDLQAGLQNLVQSLSSSATSSATTSASSTAAAPSELQTAFENLSKALQAGANTGSSKMPDLQSFLQSLQQNLQNAGSQLDSSGNLVNTQA